MKKLFWVGALISILLAFSLGVVFGQTLDEPCPSDGRGPAPFPPPAGVYEVGPVIDSWLGPDGYWITVQADKTRAVWLGDSPRGCSKMAGASYYSDQNCRIKP